MLELLKVMVQPVVLERDPDGRITGEKLGDTVALFTPEQLPEFVTQLRQQIEAANNAEHNGSTHPVTVGGGNE